MTSLLNFKLPQHTHNISPLSMGERDGYFTPTTMSAYPMNPNQGININGYPGITNGSPMNMAPMTPVMTDLVSPMNLNQIPQNFQLQGQPQAQPQNIQLQGQAQAQAQNIQLQGQIVHSEFPQHSNQVYYYPPFNQYVYYQPSSYPSIESQNLSAPYFPPVPMSKKSKLSTTWSPKEDKILRELKEIQKLGWREISSFFIDRTPNACQFRWRRMISGTSVGEVAKRRGHHDLKFILN